MAKAAGSNKVKTLLVTKMDILGNIIGDTVSFKAKTADEIRAELTKLTGFNPSTDKGVKLDKDCFLKGTYYWVNPRIEDYYYLVESVETILKSGGELVGNIA